MATPRGRGAQALNRRGRLSAPLATIALVSAAVPVAAEEPLVAAPWATVSLVVGAVVLALQSALIVLLLAHRSQRRRAQDALAERLRFETLLSGLSATFVGLPAGDVSPAIESGLQRIVTELDI